MKRFKSYSSRGDTIVEVLIGIVLLGAAIGLATVSANHNYAVGVDSAVRDRANTVAQGQIEFIRNAYNAKKKEVGSEGQTEELIKAYRDAGGGPNKKFCILEDHGEVDSLDNPTNKCHDFDDGNITVENLFGYDINGDKLDNVFTIHLTWATSANGSGQSELTLYYKLPD